MPFVHALTVQIFKVYLFAVGFVTRASIRSVISWWSTSILYTLYTYSHTYAYEKILATIWYASAVETCASVSVYFM